MILILNGPNLNLQGKREPEIYGRETLEEFLSGDAESLIFQQSNIEGELINYLHAADENPDITGIVFNAGGYSHTSIALADAVKAISKPVILVHISNIYARERERHTDLLAAYSAGQIVGLGLFGYSLAIYSLQRSADSDQRTADSKQRSATSPQLTADSWQRSANSDQRSANS